MTAQGRELSDQAIAEQAKNLYVYLKKAKNGGASFWLDSKGFAPADRAAIVLALGDRSEAAS